MSLNMSEVNLTEPAAVEPRDLMEAAAGAEGEAGDAGGAALDTQELYFIAYGIVPPVVIAFGVVGNLLTLIVLSRPNFRAVSYTYIRWLACSDLLAMLIWLPIIAKDGWKVPLTTVHAARYYAHWHLLLHNTFLASSAFLVVALSVERYVSVCHPAQAKHLITPQRAKAVVGVTYLVAAAIHVPYVFEEQWTRLNSTAAAPVMAASDGNDTSPRRGPSPEVGELYTVDRNMDIYGHPTWSAVFEAYSWILATVTKFIPIILVAALNTWTVTAFYRVVEKRQQIAGGSAKRLREQQRIMIMLICVVIIFVSCLLPMPFLYIFFNEDNLRYYGFHVFRVCANLLETGNSALNFYVYCVASQDFRHHLRLVFGACCCATGGADVHRGANGDIDATTTAPGTAATTIPMKAKTNRENKNQKTGQLQQVEEPLLNNEQQGTKHDEHLDSL